MFCDHWKRLTGAKPGLVVMDQKVTTHAVLAELNARGVSFITLRMRSKSLLAHIEALPASAWKTVHLDRSGPYQSPKVVDRRPPSPLPGQGPPARRARTPGLWT